MDQALHLRLDVPIRSVGLVAEGAPDHESRAAIKKREADLKNQCERLRRICDAMEAASDALTRFCNDTICSQAECVARLSVQIAERILSREIAAGNYDIRRIVADALKEVPAQQNVLVRLHPEDCEQYKRMVENGSIKTITGVRLIADETVGKAECVVETGQGTVEYFIHEYLRRIGEALEALQ